MTKKHVCRQHKYQYEKDDGYVEQTKDKDGYMHVKLFDDFGAEHDELVHMLVDRTFVPNPNNYVNVLHIDGNKSNNNAKNLRWWGTAVSPNVSDAKLATSPT